MDELKEAWNQLNANQQESAELTSEEVRASIYQQSKGLLEGLTRKIYLKYMVCLFFTILIGACTPFVYPLTSQILLVILFIAYTLGSYLLYREYRYLKNQSLMDSDILTTLKTFRNRVKNVVRYEEWIGLTLYPISAASGYLFGLQLGNPDIELLASTRDWLLFAGVIIIITPLGHLVARWLNRISFGRFLKEVERNIAELESEERTFEAPKSQNE